jgi:hypothetical protein
MVFVPNGKFFVFLRVSLMRVDDPLVLVVEGWLPIPPDGSPSVVGEVHPGHEEAHQKSDHQGDQAGEQHDPR